MDIYHQPWRLIQNKIRIEGGREIDKFRGISPAVDTPNGAEAWIGSTIKANGTTNENPYFGCSEVILPDGRRTYLFQVIAQAPELVLGQSHIGKFGSNLGMLIKLLDAKSQFLLQCHPTRYFAKEMWNSDYGKEESWYILSTRNDVDEPPYVFLGFKEGISRESWEEKYRAGNLPALESMCHKIPVSAGDAFFIGGGMPHALGKGCLAIEIQEPSDLTAVPISQESLLEYRRKSNPLGVFVPEDNNLYDKRMLGSFIYKGASLEATLRETASQNKLLRYGDWGSETLIFGREHTIYWSYSCAEINGAMPMFKTGDIQIGIITAGSGTISFNGGELHVKKGDELFFPHDIQNCTISGDMKIVLCNPGDAPYC